VEHCIDARLDDSPAIRTRTEPTCSAHSAESDLGVRYATCLGVTAVDGGGELDAGDPSAATPDCISECASHTTWVPSEPIRQGVRQTLKQAGPQVYRSVGTEQNSGFRQARLGARRLIALTGKARVRAATRWSSTPGCMCLARSCTPGSASVLGNELATRTHGARPLALSLQPDSERAIQAATAHSLGVGDRNRVFGDRTPVPVESVSLRALLVGDVDHRLNSAGHTRCFSGRSKFTTHGCFESNATLAFTDGPTREAVCGLVVVRRIPCRLSRVDHDIPDILRPTLIGARSVHR
jgi:hypothetical protein